MQSELYDETPKSARIPKRQFGNREGFRLLSRLEALMDSVEQERKAAAEARTAADEARKTAAVESKAAEKRLADFREEQTKAMETVQKRLAVMEPFYDDTLLLRKSILHEWRGGTASRPKGLVKDRNLPAHGGHIVADVEVIEKDLETSNSTVSLLAPGFSRHYGITFAEARNIIRDGAPEQIIQTLNIRVHVRVMAKWQLAQKRVRRKAIEEAADYLISAYRSSTEEQRKRFFAPGSTPLTKFNQMADRFDE